MHFGTNIAEPGVQITLFINLSNKASNTKIKAELTFEILISLNKATIS